MPRQTKRVHIVGLSPRTGTTLMMELMVSCYRFDGHADHEMPLCRAPRQKVGTYCTKSPSDLEDVTAFLDRDPNLWVICVVRDPRDAIVSTHAESPDKYWTGMRFFLRTWPFFEKIRAHPRFMTIRYEDLVTDPNAHQTKIGAFLPFLEKINDFNAFHKVATPTPKAKRAMGGLRKVETGSIGRWREHLPRIKAQAKMFTALDTLLVELGYEKDNGWRSVLDNVTADNGQTRHKDGKSPKRKPRHRVESAWYRLRYRVGLPKKKNIVVTGQPAA